MTDRYTCPKCGGKLEVVLPSLAHIQIGASIPGGKGLPISLACTKCDYVKYNPDNK